jgi:hypothetical protein
MPQRLKEWRHVIAPAAGAVVILAVTFAAPGQLLMALVAGGLTWAGSALLLSPANPFARLRGRSDLAIDAAAMEAELTLAQARIETIAAAAEPLSDEVLQGALMQITGIASTILDEVNHQPAGYPQVRKALVHYLAHTAAIAEGVARLDERDGGSGTRERARQTLPRLAQVFAQYRDRALERDVFDIETRISVLEQELQQVALPPGKKAEGGL